MPNPTFLDMWLLNISMALPLALRTLLQGYEAQGMHSQDPRHTSWAARWRQHWCVETIGTYSSRSHFDAPPSDRDHHPCRHDPASNAISGRQIWGLISLSGSYLSVSSRPPAQGRTLQIRWRRSQQKDLLGSAHLEGSVFEAFQTSKMKVPKFLTFSALSKRSVWWEEADAVQTGRILEGDGDSIFQKLVVKMFAENGNFCLFSAVWLGLELWHCCYLRRHNSSKKIDILRVLEDFAGLWIAS